jgi:hypothetical protein
MINQIGHKNGGNLVETGSSNPMPVKPSATDYDWTSASAGPVVNTSNVAFKFSVAGKKIFLTSIQMKNTGTVPTEVVIKSGANILFRTLLVASMTVGENIQFPTPLQTVAGDSLTFACITTGASVYVNAQGYVES